MTIEGCVLSSERIRHLKCPATWFVLEGAPGPEQGAAPGAGAGARGAACAGLPPAVAQEEGRVSA